MSANNIVAKNLGSNPSSNEKNEQDFNYSENM
jgi:hypothetical protein